jgi:hypothetical protein
LLTKIAGTTAGATAGAMLDKDDPKMGAVYGAAGGWAAGSVIGRKIIGGGMASALMATNPAGKEVFDQMEARTAAWVRSAANTTEGIKQLEMRIPEGRRLAVINALETGNFDGLAQDEKAAALAFRNAVDQIGGAAQRVGLIKNLRPNHVPLQFNLDDPRTLQRLKELNIDVNHDKVIGFTTFTPHQLERTYDTYAQAMGDGMKPRSLQLADIYRDYANSVIKATENKRALLMLQNVKDANGIPMVAHSSTPDLPKDWVSIRGMRGVHVPEMDDFMVHPDIADSVKLGLSSYDPSIVGRAALSTSWTLKRIATGFSGFHQVNLMLGAMGAMGARGPMAVVDFMAGAGASGLSKASLGTIPKLYKSGVDKALEAYKAGGQNDAIDYLIRNGLTLTSPLEEAQGRDAMHRLGRMAQNYLDWKTPSGVAAAGKAPIKTIMAIDEGFQKFTFDYTMTGFKLLVATQKFEREVVRNAKANAAGKEPLKDLNRLAADASSYANSIFGGVNWRRVAEDVENKVGRQLAMELASPGGKAGLQVLLFAPDWKLSTLQAWTRGLGLSATSPELERFHRDYLLWGALTSMTIADGMNLALSGHHIWENHFPRYKERYDFRDKIEDMTRIDLGDGRYIHWNKHFNEGPHAAAHPAKFAANALSVPAATTWGALSGSQWPGGPPISKPYSRDILGDYASWALQRGEPIGIQQLLRGTDAGIYGMLGMPVSGKARAAP